MHKIQPCPEPSACCLFILPLSNSFYLLFSDAPNVSVGTEYPDDFEEVELEEHNEGEAASAHGAAPRQLSDDVLEAEFWRTNHHPQSTEGRTARKVVTQ